MRKIIGIGETILDILFKQNQPTAAVPGGSVFNGMISLGRLGANVTFLSEIGDDHVGRMILDFMKGNGVSADWVQVLPEKKSPVSLAFLDENNDAEYVFYRENADSVHDGLLPDIHADDILILSSYYAINPLMRSRVKEILEKAHTNGAIIYYDVNFRSAHKTEGMKLLSSLLENFEYADIIRGSVDDFMNLYNLSDADKVYKQKIAFYTPLFIYTSGSEDVRLYTKHLAKSYPVPATEAISTIGAGDNFNAGILFGLIKYGIRRDDLLELKEEDWDKIIQCGLDLSAEVCKSVYNYIPEEFAAKYK